MVDQVLTAVLMEVPALTAAPTGVLDLSAVPMEPPTLTAVKTVEKDRSAAPTALTIQTANFQLHRHSHHSFLFQFSPK
jgi:hypothetical protein